MKGASNIVHLFELDDEIFLIDGPELVGVADVADVPGDKRLTTDFKESMSRCMSVDGPPKYAEMLVRRKLQEAGEFEEPVEILTHWKRKKGGVTDIFFTAVPTRLARYYFEELNAGRDIVLVFAMYGALWHMARTMAGNGTLALIFRHGRFADVLVASRRQVFFANRCVAFDTQPEQLNALWQSIRADIETTADEQHITVDRMVCLSSVGAFEAPDWPQDWLERIVPLPVAEMRVDGQAQPITWPAATAAQRARQSVAPLFVTILHYAKRWAPALNLAMLTALILLTAGMAVCRQRSVRLAAQTGEVKQQIERLAEETAQLPTVAADFAQRLKFVRDLAAKRRQPSYEQIIGDLTHPDFYDLSLSTLALTYAPDQVRIHLTGNIEAPFDAAHSGYKRLLRRLTTKGYRIEENRFETRISTSQVVLTLSRPMG
ncbi:MAG: hypothetical protein HKP58_06175 [Desulfatitalea sp.]|nr:hypothetical protein [Desulfatitalea sp.]NNJ99983.1 hypothetical protein [Desulfatitalea sp.]